MSPKKVTLLTSIGAGLEYYDFVIYGMMASYLSTLFFSGEGTLIPLVKTFGVFAIGYIVRPLGGVFFGMIGDTLGRKKTFLIVMLLMAFATFGIGLLPTYSQIGVGATCLLVFLRLVQGISFGAELPAAITVVSESVDQKEKSTYCGFVISSVSIGATLASFILFLLSKTLNQEQILSWGWRIPFYLGGVLALASYFIRSHLQETPEFIRSKSERRESRIVQPLLALIRFYREETLIGLGITGFLASLVIFALYLPTFLNQHFNYAMSDVYLSLTVGMIWSALSLPFCGMIADRVGRKRVLTATCLTFTILGFMLFKLLNVGTLTALIVFMCLYQTMISFLMTTYFALLTELFPTPVRFTGIAACYNIVYSLMGFAPALITYLLKITGKPEVAIWFLLAFALLTIFSCAVLEKKERLRAYT
jgi:MFS family permease